MIRLDNVCKTYKSLSVDVPALKHVTFEITRGEFVLLLGKSGSGKTSLLNVIGGLLRPEEGTVYINDDSLYDIPESKRAKIRSKDIGYIFQNYNLINELTVIDNIRLPQYINRYPHDLKRETDLLERIGLSDRTKFYPEQLSGGEKQRLAIARSILMDPLVILADEPTGNLHSITSNTIQEIIYEAHQHGQTIIMATHDSSWSPYATRILEIKDGNLISSCMN